MILQLVCLTFLALCIVVVVCLFLFNAITLSWKYLQFKKQLKSINIASGMSLIDGHLRSIVFQKHLIHKLGDLFDTYGKTFGIMIASQPCALTTDLDLIKRIIVDKKQLTRLPVHIPLKEMAVDNILTCEPDQWYHIRRAFAPAFKSNKFMTANVQLEIDGSINKLIEAIEIKLNASISDDLGRQVCELTIDDLMHRYSLDLILSCFYKQNAMVDFSSETEALVELIDRGLEETMHNPMMWICATFPIFKPIVSWLIQFHPQGKWQQTILDFVKRQTKLNLEARNEIRRSKEAGEQVNEDDFQLEDGSRFSRNMIDHVIDQFHDGKLTKQEYFHSTWFLFGASDKTSLDCLVATMYQLAINPVIQKKLRQSIVAEGPSSEYLGWVLSESLRFLPPAMLGCPRILTNDIELDNGGLLSAGVSVSTPAYAIHRLPEYWGQDAEEFKPERFANTDHFHPFQYIPFGAGPRMCPGKEFALHEMRKVLSALFTRYKIECEPIDIKYDSPYFVFILPDKQTKVKFTRLKSQDDEA